MKILFFGRGVIGTQYAWALEQAGHTVEFYVREGRKAQYGSHVTLEIRDARRRKKDRLIQQQWPIVIHEEIKENHDYDLIVMSVNPEQVSSAVKYLAPRVGPATVLFFNNYWHDPRVAVQPIPLRQLVVGFPGAGGGFEGNTLYGSLYKMVQLGTLASEPTPREIQVRKLFTEAGFTTKVQKDIQGWLRNHFALNVAMEVEVLKSGSFKQVVTSSEALAGISRNLKEMLPVLQAKGSKPDAMTRLLAALPSRWIGYLMHSFVFTPTSMAYIAVEHNHYPVGHAVKEVIADARKHGIQVPRLFAVEHLIK